MNQSKSMRILISALLMGLQIFISQANGANIIDISAWREDVEQFAKELPKRHKNLFLHFPSASFEKDISNLKRDLPQLSDQNIVFRLQQIAAQAGDLHTRVIGGTGPVFPMSVEQFGDDFFVTAVAQEELRYLLGAKLLGIDDANMDEIRQAGKSLISAENKFAIKAFLPKVIADADALHFLGITFSKDVARFKFELADKIVFKDVRAEKNFFKTAWSYAYKKTPLSVSRPAEIYWKQVLPDERAIYVNYSRCEERKDLPFAQFANEIAATFNQQQIDRVIIDLRTNPGGNEAIIRPLIQVLNEKKVPVFVLIGRRTFSSAFGNALSIKTQLKGILIGEPTGQKPNAFGEIEVFTLKNSQLKVQYSTKWWARLKGRDPEALFPDIAIETGFEQYKNGEDLVLKTALTHN